MVTDLAAPRLLRPPPGSLGRITAVTTRNLVAVRHSGYWLVVISGFAEPLLYLLAIGVGVGRMVGDFTLADGSVVTYAAFVAPAMLASSAMSGALAEATYNFFARMKYARLYDAMLATPLTPFEIAIGELAWAMLRGSLYSVAFLAIMVGLNLTTVGWALVAVPAALLISFAFGALGLAVATFVRSWQDFDYMSVVQFGMFLFSGTFAPVDSYPAAFQVVVQITPLYHGVELIRALTTGVVGLASLGHVAYLLVLAALGIWVAGRRMRRLLCR